MNPRYPIYIPSKGRWESRLTIKALDKLHVPYRVIVEEQEYEQYASVIDKKSLLILDKTYQDIYNPCDTLKRTISLGPGPARNFAWDHAIQNNFKWHWVMDDNIRAFYYRINNTRYYAGDATMFFLMEEFVERHSNIAMAGPCYRMFVNDLENYPPFILNTRIYSCNLIRNDIPYRWRGRYNEDTDLSLRILKDGWCTVQFVAFLAEKIRTQIIKGGNTKEFYSKLGTLPKSKMLVMLHPDVARLSYKFNRWHHHVDYSSFSKNKLILREEYKDKPLNIEYFIENKLVGEESDF